MSMMQEQPSPNASDALIDEVRGIRREICREFGNDIDLLYDHLREVERDYAARRGIFSGVSKEAAAQVVERWGKDALRSDDAIVDEVRAIRKGLSERQP